MESVDAARVMAALHGAYPHLDVDDAVANVWVNTLCVADYRTAMEAVEHWINQSRFWPSIAEFNAVMTQIRRSQRDDQPAIERQAPRGVACDGSGWFDRGVGMEPCPRCNSWARERWDNGDWHNTKMRPPSNWVADPECRPSHAGEGSVVVSYRRAMQLVIGGLREEMHDQGYEPEEIDEIVARRMKTVSAVVAGVE